MSYGDAAHKATTALTNIAHAFTRLATATERIAAALEEQNEKEQQRED